MKKEVLNIKELSFSYSQENQIYKNFNLSLHKGEIKSIVGSSGSGKSTLFELITNNLKPNNGIIKHKNISSIFQDPYSSFHPTYTIYEQVNDVVESFADLDILLKKFGLNFELFNQMPHKLSGGQLQRCSIIRSILMKPDLILADEPLSALDNILAFEVMKTLLDFKDKFGLLLITHDYDLAQWCSDEIIDIENVK